ncbi:Uncharacterised protein [Candidatus Norongarragalina meridionalis]|nr:Uncharacterised protein [Candidatus Norongarragalina meridionalis]
MKRALIPEAMKTGAPFYEQAVIEPVFGCPHAEVCGHCGLGNMAEEMRFMRLATLRSRLNALDKHGFAPKQIFFCLGETAAHPRLHEITAELRKRYKPEIELYWSLAGVENRKTLIKRTKGISNIAISFSDDLLKSFMRGRNETEAREEMMRRIGWAADAAKANGFGIKFDVVYGSDAERSRWTEFMDNAISRFGIRDAEVRNQQPLQPRGFEQGEMIVFGPKILHDGSVVLRYPKKR